MGYYRGIFKTASSRKDQKICKNFEEIKSKKIGCRLEHFLRSLASRLAELKHGLLVFILTFYCCMRRLNVAFS